MDNENSESCGLSSWYLVVCISVMEIWKTTKCKFNVYFNGKDVYTSKTLKIHVNSLSQKDRWHICLEKGL